MTAVENDHHFARWDRAQRLGKLGTGDGGRGEVVARGVVRIHWQQIFPGLRSALDATAVAGEVDEDAGLGIGGGGEVGKRAAECFSGGLLITDEPDMLGQVAAVASVGHAGQHEWSRATRQTLQLSCGGSARCWPRSG
jgi:hypothetical protein